MEPRVPTQNNLQCELIQQILHQTFMRCASTLAARQIVNVARTWIDTPFHELGRVKGVGCDCFGFIMGISKELDVYSKMGRQFTCYDLQHYEYKRDSYLLDLELDKHFTVINNIALGAIIVLKFNKFHFHVGVISNIEPLNKGAGSSITRGKSYFENEAKINIIHACSSAGKVVENTLPHSWYKRVHKLYQITVK
ncbi:conserved hypothetical protein [Alphaproteobacteria bacterium]